MKELINHKILDIYISSHYVLKFLVEDEIAFKKELCYTFNGDCCSECWISEIIGYSNIKNRHQEPKKVIDVIKLDLGITNLLTKQETDDVYAYTITFEDNSHLLVLFRNSSNGYYGGWCSLESDLSYYKDLNFIKLTDDYYFFNSKSQDN